MKIPRLSRLSPGIYPWINALIEERAKVKPAQRKQKIIIEQPLISSLPPPE